MQVYPPAPSLAKYYPFGFIAADTLERSLPSWVRWFWRVRTWEVSDNASGLPPMIVDTGIFAGGLVQAGLVDEQELYEKRDQWVHFASEGVDTVNYRSSYMDLGGYLSFVAADQLTVNPRFQYAYYSPDSPTAVHVFPPDQGPGLGETAGSTIILDGVAIPANSQTGFASGVTVTIAPKTFWANAKTDATEPIWDETTGAQLRSPLVGPSLE